MLIHSKIPPSHYNNIFCYCKDVQCNGSDGGRGSKTDNKNIKPSGSKEVNTFECVLFTLLKVLRCLVGITLNHRYTIIRTLEFERRKQLKLDREGIGNKNKKNLTTEMIYDYFNNVFPSFLNVFFTKSVLKKTENTEEDNKAIIETILYVTHRLKDFKKFPISIRNIYYVFENIFKDGKCKEDCLDPLVNYATKAIYDIIFPKKKDKSEQEEKKTLNKKEDAYQNEIEEIEKKYDDEEIKVLICSMIKKNFRGAMDNIYEDRKIFYDEETLFNKVLKGDKVAIPEYLTIESKFLDKFMEPGRSYTLKEHGYILDFINEIRDRDKSKIDIQKMYEEQLDPSYIILNFSNKNTIINLIFFSLNVIYEFIEEYEKFPTEYTNQSKEEIIYIEMCKDLVRDLKSLFTDLIKEGLKL